MTDRKVERAFKRFEWLGKSTIGGFIWSKEQSEATEAKYRECELFEIALQRESYGRVKQWLIGDRLFTYTRDQAGLRGYLSSEQFESDSNPVGLLDLDVRAAKHDEECIINDILHHPSVEDRIILATSKVGEDRVALREFDLNDCLFKYEDAFRVFTDDVNAAWVEPFTLLVPGGFDSDSRTSAKRSRLVKCFKPGDSLRDGKIEFQASTHQFVGTRVFHHGGLKIFFTGYHGTAHESLYYLSGNKKIRLNLPKKTVPIGTYENELILHLWQDWVLGDKSFPVGSLVSVELASLLKNQPIVKTIRGVSADQPVATSHAAITADAIVVVSCDPNGSQLEIYKPQDEAWSQTYIKAFPQEYASLEAQNEHSKKLLMIVSNEVQEASSYRLETTGMTETLYSGAPSPDLEVKVHWAVSKDGTEVPYRVAKQRAVKSGPTILNFYGGYGVIKYPGYSPETADIWLKSGGLQVHAFPRGGRELGPTWYTATNGQAYHKSVEDLEAVIRDLLKRGYTTPAQLGIGGESHGGLLAANCLTDFPELLGAVYLGVPHLDLLGHSPQNHAQYGDPSIPEQLERLKRYAPFQKLKTGADYPPTLVIGAAYDDRVAPGDARRMAAVLKSLGCEADYYQFQESAHDFVWNMELFAKYRALTFSFFKTHLSSVN